jgi:peptidoglycan-N-acetylglucosamine deacetylase
MKTNKLICLILCWFTFAATAQQKLEWNNKKAAVVLTYDDAIDVDLDNVIPSLDSVNLKGTFYLIGNSPVTRDRMGEWRKAAANGHELGNHSLFHPCDGGPGRSFVTEENDLRRYTIARVVNEILATNTLLKAIDGKDKRTFAYPCGDLKIGENYFYPEMKKSFSGARGVKGAMNTIESIKLDDIDSYPIIGHSADYMIGLVKEAIAKHVLVVFLFHGVGGGHPLNVDLKEHNKLLRYLKQHENELWIAPMVDVAEYVKHQRGL